MFEAMSLEETTEALRRGDTELDEYVDSIRRRTEKREPDVHAFVDEPDQWARVERERTEIERIHGETYGERPPLYGVPVGVKDLFHARELETRAGTDLPPEALTRPEGGAVSALRAAGTIVLGKTVTTEFGYYDPGPTRNPRDLERTPGGSSSGSAAAVAAGMCPLALGTQTVGSIVRPAAFCGIVGLKPSHGRISSEGVLPMAPSVDHVGYFTATVADATFVAPLLYEDWTANADPGTPTLGVPADAYLEKASESGRRHFRAQCNRLEEAGVEIRRVPNALSEIDAIIERHQTLVEAEASLSHYELFEEYGDRYSETISELVTSGRTVDSGSLGGARTKRLELRRELDALLDDHGIDVWVSPAAPGPAPKGIDDTGDPVMNLPWTHTGLPAVTVPVSETDGGLPLGLQCTARFGDDERLLAWADIIGSAFSADS
ncbi:amidase [Natrinema caseinilyticum]|uniref:amidase n=1 Tax=Natrinema caseinilyticum TaxID=2961570 RepID=UPI0020C5717A|nr:amidase [Natrinema caseinilyticum]